MGETKTLDGVRATYDVVLILKVTLLLLHRTEDDLKGVNHVVEDDYAPLLALQLRETAGVNQTHLFEDGRLATLSGAYHTTRHRSAKSAGKTNTAGGHLPSKSNLTSLACLFRSMRSILSISSFRSASTSSFLLPKHMIAGAMRQTFKSQEVELLF